MRNRGDDRHLSPDGLQTFLAAGVRATVPLDGDPPAQLQIDPVHGELALDVALASDLTVELEPYTHVEVDVVHHDGRRWARVGITGRDVLELAYPVLCAIADRVQRDGVPVAAAIREALRRYRMLLDTLDRLPADAEVGLFGELLILNHLISRVGADDALVAWLGALGEEHDFSLPALDLEVKATTSERRRHRIGTLTQLVSTPNRDLWLVSVQLTTGGAAAAARTLPMLIADIQSSLTEEQQLTLDEGLSSAGYKTDAAGLYTRAFVLRSEPATFLASDPGFPRLTPDALVAAGADLSRIPELSYTIDLSGLSAGRLELLDPVDHDWSHRCLKTPSPAPT